MYTGGMKLFSKKKIVYELTPEQKAFLATCHELTRDELRLVNGGGNYGRNGMPSNIPVSASNSEKNESPANASAASGSSSYTGGSKGYNGMPSDVQERVKSGSGTSGSSSSSTGVSNVSSTSSTSSGSTNASGTSSSEKKGGQRDGDSDSFYSTQTTTTYYPSGVTVTHTTKTEPSGTTVSSTTTVHCPPGTVAETPKSSLDEVRNQDSHRYGGKESASDHDEVLPKMQKEISADEVGSPKKPALLSRLKNAVSRLHSRIQGKTGFSVEIHLVPLSDGHADVYFLYTYAEDKENEHNKKLELPTIRQEIQLLTDNGFCVQVIEQTDTTTIEKVFQAPCAQMIVVSGHGNKLSSGIISVNGGIVRPDSLKNVSPNLQTVIMENCHQGEFEPQWRSVLGESIDFVGWTGTTCVSETMRFNNSGMFDRQERNLSDYVWNVIKNPNSVSYSTWGDL